MRILRSDQVALHVSVAGVPLDSEVWDMLEGGEIANEEVIVYPGAMQEQIALGGVSKRSPITVERLWSEAMIANYKALERACVVAAAVTVSYTLLGPEQASTGFVFTYTGVASGVTRPNYKAGQSEEAKIQLKISPNGPIG
jgi:hypothetical protein